LSHQSRIGVAMARVAVFLELNGQPVTAVANNTVYELVISVASGDASVDEIAAELQRAISSP